LVICIPFTRAENQKDNVWIAYSHNSVGWSWEQTEITITTGGWYQYSLGYPKEIKQEEYRIIPREFSRQLSPEEITKIKEYLGKLNMNITSKDVNMDCMDGSTSSLRFTLNGVEKSIGGSCCAWPKEYGELISFIDRLGSDWRIMGSALET